MPLKIGTRLGPYEILSSLGVGGMGEVYKARDTRLDRTVAIKVLREHRASDPERRARFEREARAVSKLNHPNICTLYDVGHDNGTDFLVVEFLDGESLAERLEKGALPIDQVLTIAIQIASALDTAHRAGIVHRDLKPANVMLTKTGAKLLDFGIARSTAGFAESATAANKPSTLTSAGTLIGTLQYMAPEQLEGREADARTDMFAFGALLYEMLSSRQAFGDDTLAGVMVAVLEREPPSLRLTRPEMPEALCQVVSTCLAKQPDRRWQNAADVAIQLKWIQERRREVETVWVARRPRLSLLSASAIAVSLGVALTYWITSRSLASSASTRPITLSLLPPEGTSFDSVALSPSGQQIAYTATDHGGHSRLWLRALGVAAARPLAGTEDAAFPFWSPDERFIAFSSGRALKKVRIDDGVVETICSFLQSSVTTIPAVTGSRGGSWSRTGSIIFAGATTPLFRTHDAPGSAIESLTRLDESLEERSHRWPSFLPDGHHYLYAVRSGNPSIAGVYVADLASSERRRLLPDVTNATYGSTAAPDDGYLLFARRTELMAQPFDLHRMQLTGEPSVVASNVAFAEGFSLSAYSASQSGTLVYESLLPNQNTELMWFDRTGRRLDVMPFECNRPRLSPDDRKLVFDCVDPQSGGRNVWVRDLVRGVRWRVAPGAFAVWSPDGMRVVLGTTDIGNKDIVDYDAGGSGAARLLMKSTAGYPAGWSPDGRFVVIRNPGDLSLLELTGPEAGHSVVYQRFTTRFGTGGAINGDGDMFSPDGTIIAYDSYESGRREIIVQTFDPSRGPDRQSRRWQVSDRGGVLPRWRRDGAELLYLSTEEQQVKSVQITRSSSGIEPHAPTSLFSVALSQTLQPEFDVTADGQHFLLQVPGSSSVPSPATVLVNWPALLKH